MADQVYPEPVVGVLIFNPEGKAFLMKSHKWSDLYVIPGGHVELGETLEQTAIREIKEETGLDIFDVNFITFKEFIYGEQFLKKKHFIFLDMVAKTKSEDVTLNDEGQEYVWVTLDEALEMPLEKYTLKVIKEYQKKFAKN